MNKVIINGLERAIEENAVALKELLESKEWYFENGKPKEFYREYQSTIKAIYVLKSFNQNVIVENLTQFKALMCTIEAVTGGYYNVDWGEEYITIEIE